MTQTSITEEERKKYQKKNTRKSFTQHWIHSSQYGFGKDKCTQDLVFILRQQKKEKDNWMKTKPR